MSRIGKKPIPLPKGVKVALELPLLKVSGPKGNLSERMPEGVAITVEGDQVLVARPEDPKRGKSLQGLSRTLIANMVKGVSEGFERVLEINGVGYRANFREVFFSSAWGFRISSAFPSRKE